MPKKTIIISVIAVLVIAAIVVGALYVIKLTTQPSAKLSQSTTVPDLSQDYGACDLLSISSIKKALGAPATSLTTGYNTGKGQAGGGDLEQNCVYGLQKKVTAISNTMLTNTFYTTVYLYKNQTNKTNDATAYNDVVTTINGIGDKAGFFTTTDPSQSITEYSVRVDVGLRYFVFAIRQATAKESFSTSSARTALTTLAKEVAYAKFKDME